MVAGLAAMTRELSGIGMTSLRTRERMVTRLVEQGIRDPRVLEVMRSVPRHLFVDEALGTRAYEDTALPIGNGQTISQPYVVARMSEILATGPLSKVLEIGAGSGYQSAILALLASEVFSVERVGDLVRKARERLRRLQIHNVRLRHGDGYQGWSEYGPYDAILVAAAPAEVPSELTAQLADGGRMVLPVGTRGTQQLLLIRRSGAEFTREVLETVSFVPMLSGANR